MGKGKNKGSDERPSKPSRGSTGKHRGRSETKHHGSSDKFHTKLAMWVSNLKNSTFRKAWLMFPSRISITVIQNVVVGKS